ncbi:MAG: EamA family transporter [Patescibacteria group bacterium]|nr:EamA family transporter [Patescibacteria group bacterium]
MNWFLSALLSLLFVVIYRLVQKKLISKDKVNPVLFGLAESTWVVVFTIPLVFYFGFEFTGDARILLITIFKSFLSGISAVLLYISLSKIAASEFQILTSSRFITAFFIGITLLSEKITYLKILSVILLFISVILITDRKDGKFKLGKYHFIALASSILFAVVAAFDKTLLNYFNTVTFTFLTFAVSQIFKLFLTPKNTKIIPKYFSNINNILTPMITSVPLFGIYALQYFSYQSGGDISAVNIITSTSTVFIVLFGVLFLNEKKNLWKKILASILVTVSIILFKNSN